MNDQPFDFTAALDTAETIARQAGAILRSHFERPHQINHKSTVVDLVTEADRESEAFIVGALQTAFPDHYIVGEEGGGYGSETAPYRWYVDPLDGTTNFAHRFPVFATCLALSDPDLHPLLGVIYDPLRDECFKAIRGGGSYLNGRRLHVSTIRELGQAMAVTGFPYDRWVSPENNIAHAANFIVRTQGLRRVGSAALDLCYVAAGRCDVYWERGVNPWDVQGGILMVEEAGGRVTDFHGDVNWDALSGKHILATNSHLHDQAVTVLVQGNDAPRPGPK
jgi:myo-inositol-1(or 4)-monophosphatase